ncbi:MFS transporter [Rhodococcus sp. IEGM 1401]|uniref:MFS transporter n=1 Tax=Rhodococcus cercidiphylli TaxID=489916 RepID=A0ABU4B551_9NOCA|nr:MULTISPECIES: MFS transporter [Rhodococcus]MCZ4563728.1 MFS transporter [Rhodococcus sp. IEGM 1401]MDI6626898.1 MFS transporter [Rhodococcus sp. (in: high G+C Gram-positive bacteria)]MDI9923850.1 MFS transporter [Rhodococcus sp. IEGM 1372]MDI9926642.1 MFS transporter [Rhodococcus sp. IEGM 1341]MDV6233643.1 MFS transporter [Rhodococcus cercidiphylli]
MSSTHAVADGAIPAPQVPRSRIVIASMVGTSIEFFDFYIYATAAVLVFPRLFFPAGNDTTALLASFATFGLAFVARPIGSILFGHFGDRIGRKATLVGSLLTMGVATFAIGLLPTYAAVGLWAPALLAIMRFTQGVGLGGEWSGAALLATETAKPGKRAWAAMYPQLGAPIGFFFANGIFLLIVIATGYDSANSGTDHAFLTWGWRIPFLLSAIMVIIGLYVRLKLEETPVFKLAVERGQKVKTPLAQVFKTSWRQLIIGTFVMLATYTLFYIMTTWVVSYGTGKVSDVNGPKLAIPYTDFLELQLIAVLFFAALIPVAGLLADKYGRRPTLIVITTAIVLFGLSFHWFADPASASAGKMLVFMCVGLGLMGLTFGPMSAVLPELFPTNVRYTGSGISYNTASILGAAVAPFIATWLVSSYGVGWVGVYLAIAAALTLISLIIMKETRDQSLDSV